MAALTTIIAGAALAVSAVGGYASYQQGRAAQQNARRSANEQRKSQEEVRAQNMQRAADERRQQAREERVRRARIEQSAENSGTSGSSGELGALGALSTNFSVNQGTNIGAQASAQRQSIFNTAAAGYQSAAQQNQFNSQVWGQVSSFGGSIFQQAGGFNTLQQAYKRANP